MRFLTVVALLMSVSANAAITEHGRGVLFGEDHAFAVTAANGWVLDNESGVNQGVHMAFYPVGQTWATSPVIIYGRMAPTHEVSSIPAQVARTVRDFKGNGSPDYEAHAKPPVTLPDGRKAEVYYFAGDQWGNHEAAAYFQEADTINFLVFNARSKTAFDQYVDDFVKIARTYKNLYSPPSALTAAGLEALKLESETLLADARGKDYETKAVQANGQSMADTMQGCLSYMRDKQPAPFDYFVRIGGDGTPAESHVSPTSALSVCFKGMLAAARYPGHDFGTFVLHIEMKVSP